MKPIYLLLLISFVSCGTIKYKKTSTESFPELGTIGVYTNYLFKKDLQSKTVVNLTSPIRLSYKEILINKRTYFNKKDSTVIVKDSTLLSIEILDNISLIKQLNSDKELLKYVSKSKNYRLVSQVTIHFPDSIYATIEKADELYLMQNKQKTLSLELRKNNKAFDQIEFADGSIISFNSLGFCWGQNKRRKIEIFDLVSKGSKCGNETNTSIKKVKKKNEFKY